jgi:hypothetical protein
MQIAAAINWWPTEPLRETVIATDSIKDDKGIRDEEVRPDDYCAGAL